MATNHGDTLPEGQVLEAGDYMTSTDKRYTFTQEPAGNLVLRKQGYEIWRLPSSGPAPCRAVMQHDGNFVVYDANHVALWWTESFVPGSGVACQSDGNVVLYTPTGEHLWDTETEETTPPTPSDPTGDDYCCTIFNQGNTSFLRKTIPASSRSDADSQCNTWRNENHMDGFSTRKGAC